MTPRELFRNIMHYGEFDRMPVWHWTGWSETLERWKKEGLPEDPAQHLAYFKAESLPHGVPINLGLLPAFEEETIEETDTYRLLRQADGVVARHSKVGSTIPHYEDFLFKDRDAWPEYKKRLQPDPKRIPEDIDARLEQLKASNQPISFPTCSMAGILRNWMGPQQFCITCCEDPDLVAEYADTVAELVCWGIDQIAPRIQIDLGWGWEDICFKTGPLVQPSVFKYAAVPGYRKISDKLRSYGCDLHAIDCDGRIDELVPLWLEGGVNVLFPVEIGTWNADPMAFRRKYGRELRVIGGINKLVLERGRAEIDAEIERRKPLMAEGGFVPLPDHIITPGAPLEDYCYYLDRIRALRF